MKINEKKRDSNFKKVKTKLNYTTKKQIFFYVEFTIKKKYTKYTHDISLNKPTVTPLKERIFFNVRVLKY